MSDEKINIPSTIKKKIQKLAMVQFHQEKYPSLEGA